MSILGNRIRNLRESENIQQNEFAKKIGVSNVVLSRYESGERKPDYDTLETIADYFNVTIDYLLGRGDNDFTTQQIFSHRLGNSRRDKKMTAQDISIKLKIPVEKYKKFEQELTIPDGDTLKKIVEITGVSLEYLFGLTDNPKQVVAEKQDNKLTEEEFQAFANDPELERWYKELPNSEEEDLQALRQMWEIIKKNR